MLSVRWRVVVVALALTANLAVLSVLVGTVFIEPDDGGPSVAGPDLAELDAAEPDAAEPDAGDPDAGEPDAGEPDAGEPDAAEPSSSASGEPAGGASDRPTQQPAAEEPFDVVVLASVASDGTLLVRERLEASRPILQLGLSPSGASSTGVRVDQLRVEAAGVAASGPDRLAAPTQLRLPVAAAVVELRYRVRGVADPDDLAPDGRALITIRSLVTGGPAGSSATVVVSGLTVHNLVCPEQPLREQLCGRVVDEVWRTPPLPLDQSTVLAQVDLPAEGTDAGAG